MGILFWFLGHIIGLGMLIGIIYFAAQLVRFIIAGARGESVMFSSPFCFWGVRRKKKP